MLAPYLLPRTTSRIHEGMKDLCFRFCREELLARLQEDTIPKQIEEAEDDFYEQEEAEEEE